MSAAPAGGVEILRDRHGVPHIFAADVAGAYLGLGYCSAQDAPRSLPLHQLLLRGELAKHFGDLPLPHPRFPFLDVMAGTTFFRADGGNALRVDSLVDVDRWVKLFGYHASAVTELPRLKPRTRAIVEAFAEGVNRYFEESGEERYAPYEAATEIAWWAFQEHSLTVGLFGLSNAFAVAPTRTEAGDVWLGGDPHYWIHHRSEVHLVSPEFELTGIWDGHVNVGAMGGSGTTPKLAMQGTAAALETPAFYRERVNPRNREEYWDWREEAYRPFAVERHEIELDDGSAREFFARATHHGPVIAELLEEGDPVAYALRTPFDRKMGESLQEYLELWLSGSVDEALAYLRDCDYSRGHRVLADSEGNLGFATMGPAPIRSEEVDWTQILDGTSELTEIGEEAWRPGADDHALPSYRNPASGFIQSSNDASWLSTTPTPATPTEFPAYLFRPGWIELGSRGARQRHLLAGDRKLADEDVFAVMFDAYVPHAHLGIVAYREALAADPTQSGLLSPDARRLDEVLAGWDGDAEVDATAMTIAFWLDRHLDGGIPAPEFELRDDPSTEAEMAPPRLGPNAAADYVSALERTAAKLRDTYGKAAVPWGEVHVFDVPDRAVGIPGGCNSLRALLGAWQGAWDAPDIVDEGGVTHVNFGSHALRAARFGPSGAGVWSCMLGGQIAASEHPGSPHVADQVGMYAEKRLKRLPFGREEVEAQCEDADHRHCNHAARTALAAPAAAAMSGR
jgi:acyl-homoserine lactone acylase PvdQ